MSMTSSNPALKEDTFRQFGRAEGDVAVRPMTIEGTVNKTGILLLLAVISAGFTWSQLFVPGGSALVGPLTMIGLIGGLIVSLVTIFAPKTAPWSAPLYAILEGLVLGTISAIFNRKYPGIAVQAVGLTFGTLAVMLVAYRAGLIRATDKFRAGVIAATGGIFLFMLAAMLLQVFGVHGPAGMLWYSASPLAIGVSLVIVTIAALNLILDFDEIERGVAYRAPAFMEWYGAFSLMVTLVWLYIRFLRLLSQLSRR